MGYYATEPAASRGVVFKKRAVSFFLGVHRQDSLSRKTNSPASKGFHAVVLRTTAPGVPLYGYRHLSTELGRWLSRDPIGKEGGLNVYSFVSNQSLGGIDYLGLFQGNGYGFPDAFWNYYHRCVKQEGDADLTYEEASDEYDAWVHAGKPCCDTKKNRRSR